MAVHQSFGLICPQETSGSSFVVSKCEEEGKLSLVNVDISVIKIVSNSTLLCMSAPMQTLQSSIGLTPRKVQNALSESPLSKILFTVGREFHSVCILQFFRFQMSLNFVTWGEMYQNAYGIVYFNNEIGLEMCTLG